MKDSLKQFLGLLLIGQFFLIGAAVQGGGEKATKAGSTAVVAMSPVSPRTARPEQLAKPSPAGKAAKPVSAPAVEKPRKQPVTVMNVTYRSDEPYQALDF
ncbi:MAG TPA: hypothetical protein PKM25_09035, partial [Candidatus Ozemobacteraceae bacterium]|nr:hypothetical protein [Candidatus Ozemobacteraceae bacterium]